MLIIIIILIYCAICIVSGIVHYIKSPKPPNGLRWSEYHSYYKNSEWLHDEPGEEYESDSEDEKKAERIALLDETIVKYSRLLDNLSAQYKSTYNENEKARILSKQISTMEKLNGALEKREKLE